MPRFLNLWNIQWISKKFLSNRETLFRSLFLFYLFIYSDAWPPNVKHSIFFCFHLVSLVHYVTRIILLDAYKYLTTQNNFLLLFFRNSMAIYRAHMKLTIRNLQYGDFGNYRCISKNSLGETEGSIRVYGKYIHFIPILVYFFSVLVKIANSRSKMRRKKTILFQAKYVQLDMMFVIVIRFIWILKYVLSHCNFCNVILCIYYIHLMDDNTRKKQVKNNLL